MLESNGWQDEDVLILDCCSGAGGPVPTIEAIVNEQRRVSNQKPIAFVMTDIKPHVEAWKKVSAGRPHLNYINKSIDATNAQDVSAIHLDFQTGDPSHRTRKVIQLFCLSFHHFDDKMAQRVLKSTFETTDAVIIMELQDRRIFSFVLMILNFFYLHIATPLWFWNDPLHMALTYVIPVLPAIVVFDGIVSCLRTREPQEVMAIVHAVADNDIATGTREHEINSHELAQGHTETRLKPWKFQSERQLHSKPFGYMNCFIGYKKS